MSDPTINLNSEPQPATTPADAAHGNVLFPAPDTTAGPGHQSSGPAPSGMFGCEVYPIGPLQDMAGSIDIIAGQYPEPGRTAPQAAYGGGYLNAMPDGALFGGVAMPPAPQKRPIP